MVDFSQMLSSINDKLKANSGKAGPVKTEVSAPQEQTWELPTEQVEQQPQQTQQPQQPADIHTVSQSIDKGIQDKQEATTPPAQAWGLSAKKDDPALKQGEDTSDVGEPTLFNAIDVSLTDNQPGKATKSTNAAYEDYYGSQGWDKDADQDSWLDRTVNALKDLFGASGYAMAASDTGDADMWEESQRDVAKATDEAAQARDRLMDTSVDNGTMNTQNLSSNWITGAELKAQQAAGLGGLTDVDLSDYDDDTIYSKRNLQQEIGYVPYQPDDMTAFTQAAQQAASASNAIFNGIRDAQDDHGYDIHIGDKTINSNDFDRDAAVKWYNDQQGTNSYTYTDEDGTQVTFPRDTTYDTPYYEDDGVTIVQPSSIGDLVFDSLDSWNRWSEAVNATGQEGSASQFDPITAEYEAKNGMKFSYDDVKTLIDDMTEEGGWDDSNVKYDFGPANIFMPTGKTGQSTDPFAYFNPTTAVPSMAHALTSSASLFSDKIAAPVALSNAYMDMIGADSRDGRDDNGGYVKAVGDLSDEVKEALRAQGVDPDEYQDKREHQIQSEKALAELTLPASEHLLGSTGEALVPLEKWFKLQGRSPLARWLLGAAGEGAEEIPGNIWEEATDKGFSQSFAQDQLEDENGDDLYDEVGHPLYAQNAPQTFPEGLVNAWNTMFGDSTAADFAGGAAMGGLLGLQEVPRYMRERSARKNDVPDIQYDEWAKRYKERFGENSLEGEE